MSLDKAISHGKEHRKLYRGSKAIDCTCRNHGSCPWCVENRTHKFRDKEGENMRVEIKYFADDDTEFESKKECEAYEKELKTRFDAVQFFDDKCKPIPKGNLVKIESDAFFIRILDVEKATRLFDWLYRQISFNYPGCFYDKGDILHFEDNGEWENLTKEKERISEYIRRVEGR